MAKVNSEYRFHYRVTHADTCQEEKMSTWITSGRAIPCEYGIYPLNERDTKVVKVLAE